MMMEDLRNYIVGHTGGPATDSSKTVDVGLGVVAVSADASADELRPLITANREGFNGLAIDPLDGNTYDFLHLGGWLGSQELALRFMALTTAVNLTQFGLLQGLGPSIIEKGTYERIMQQRGKPAPGPTGP